MENQIEQRTNRAIASLMQNEALMEDLETEAASALLDWGSSIVRRIIAETGDLDDVTAESQNYPRLLALRQMMRQINLLAAGRYGSIPEAVGAAFNQVLARAAIAYGVQFTPPTPDQSAGLIGMPIGNPAQWIESLRSFLETKPSQPYVQE
jgi:hypothetical protein